MCSFFFFCLPFLSFFHCFVRFFSFLKREMRTTPLNDSIGGGIIMNRLAFAINIHNFTFRTSEGF